jgi:hypothetical protein
MTRPERIASIVVYLQPRVFVCVCGRACVCVRVSVCVCVFAHWIFAFLTRGLRTYFPSAVTCVQSTHGTLRGTAWSSKRYSVWAPHVRC